MPLTSLEAWLTISVFVSVLLFGVSFLFSYNELSVNSNEPFECGLESMIFNRLPFFMHFYMVAILFLIFDIEFVVVIPMAFMSINFMQWSLITYLTILILVLGLFMEIYMGTLDWKE